MPDFHASISSEVGSVSTIRADIAGGLELIVTSGIVLQSWSIDFG